MSGRILPPFLAAEDVGGALGLSTRSGRRLLSSGELGRTFRLGRRVLIRREVFLATITKLENEPRSLPGRKPTPVLPRNGSAR
ncbi:MAG: hypothetical protein V3T86_02965 [Planctomycetota bacterium]